MRRWLQWAAVHLPLAAAVWLRAQARLPPLALLLVVHPLRRSRPPRWYEIEITSGPAPTAPLVSNRALTSYTRSLQHFTAEHSHSACKSFSGAAVGAIPRVKGSVRLTAVATSCKALQNAAASTPITSES